MSRNNANIKSKGVSVWNSTLKLLMDIFGKVRYIIELLLIDNLLRKVVNWYDRRHPRSIKDNDICCDEYAHFKEHIKSLEEIISELNENLNILKSKEISLNNQIQVLLSEKRKDGNQISALIEDRQLMCSRNAELKSEIEKLQHRCLPEVEIPAMIYYAQADASGLYLRKISAARTPQHIYKLTTISGDSMSAIFEPYVDSNIHEIISNRALTLIACEIVSIGPNASRIQLCEVGKAVCENNKWKVTSKAKIFLT